MSFSRTIAQRLRARSDVTKPFTRWTTRPPVQPGAAHRIEPTGLTRSRHSSTSPQPLASASASLHDDPTSLQAGIPPIFLLALPVLAFLGYISLPDPPSPIEPHRYHSFKISRVEELSDQVKLIEIELKDERSRRMFSPEEEDESWIRWKAGRTISDPISAKQAESGTKANTSDSAQPGSIHIQHIYIKSPDLQIERPYTPINDVASEGKIVLLVKRVKGGEVGRYIHTLQEGSDVEIRGPITTSMVPLSAFGHLDMISTGTGGAPFAQFISKLHTQIICQATPKLPTQKAMRVPTIRWTQYVSKDAGDRFASEFPVLERIGDYEERRKSMDVDRSAGQVMTKLSAGQVESMTSRQSRGKMDAMMEDLSRLGWDVKIRRAWPDEIPDRTLVGETKSTTAGDRKGVMLCLPPT